MFEIDDLDEAKASEPEVKQAAAVVAQLKPHV
jgi:hypothetical protein